MSGQHSQHSSRGLKKEQKVCFCSQQHHTWELQHSDALGCLSATHLLSGQVLGSVLDLDHISHLDGVLTGAVFAPVPRFLLHQQVNETRVGTWVGELIECLMLDSPGLSCPLATSLLQPGEHRCGWKLADVSCTSCQHLVHHMPFIIAAAS